MKKRRRFRRRVLVGCFVFVAVWVLGDLVYSRVVAYHIAQWESKIERDEQGVRVDCQAYTAGDGDDAILLVHGINDSPYIYHKMVPELVQAGYTCRAMRLPGFAMTVDRYDDYRLDDWVAAVEDEIEQLRKRHKRVFLIAHSLGGAISIELLLQKPDVVDRVVLLAPAINVSSRRSPLFTTQTWHRIGNSLLFFTSVTESPFGNDAHDPAEKEYVMRTPFTPRAIIDETFHAIDQIDGRAGEFTTPLMMVVSEDDQIIDWEAARDFYKESASEEKTLYLCPDSGHAIPVDFGWQELTREIVKFLSEAEGGDESIVTSVDENLP